MELILFWETQDNGIWIITVNSFIEKILTVVKVHVLKGIQK